MTDLDRSVVDDLITGERDSVRVNGFEVRAVHSTQSEFHLAIYDGDDELTGTLDGNRYNDVNDMVNDVRVQVGLSRVEHDGLGDLFG
ncbi:hypothetical protein HCTV5_9 [Halovirus HCTV-5]|uniref:hypothetical protein n=1 Tax=Halovirus HCTV-5 TaxID=1273748 RepID=UPI0003348254|nr:hypothetical protein M200_gp009 [Halovirus HCTV-5]AGM11620.1 hypothetical protein HCTV5_9 [Halovirus HCTV-5]